MSAATINQAAFDLMQRGMPWTEQLTQLESMTGQSAQSVVETLATQQALVYIAESKLLHFTPDFMTIDYAQCVHDGYMFCRDQSQQPWLIITNPWESDLITKVSAVSKISFQVGITLPHALHEFLAKLREGQSALSSWETRSVLNADQKYENISLQTIAQDDSQVIKLVNGTLYNAFKIGASDIHWENTVTGLTIRYRLDGVLITIREVPDMMMAEQIISRLKVMAELDIGERRIPQDGRFTVSLDNQETDFRVSIMPGSFGEDAVLRLLDKRHLSNDFNQLTLDALGLDPTIKETLYQLSARPFGMLLVTGPTGSGKTTTLYALLNETKRDDEKVITIEDPVEYQLPGVLQIPVNERKGLTFARGLRSILRHDPDRILVGEIRDHETGEIAIQAALTGHLVYTTVHANSVFDVISRFRHIGIDPVSFVSALNGIVAQRLVRLCCTHCSIEPTELKDQEKRGCEHCRFTGYKGRRAISEILVMTDELRALMLSQAPIRQLKDTAKQQGMRSMRDYALDAVARGETTLAEVNRVTELS
jgi:general secretion pathway protein E